MTKVSPGQQTLLPAGTPVSFGVHSNITVNSDRNDRDHFTRSGPNPNYAGYNGFAMENGTYSSHPNLRPGPVQGTGESHSRGHSNRKLPAIPMQPSALKLSQWRQSSLPEEHNPPGLQRDVQPLQPSEKHQPLQSSERHRRQKPMTPTKPSTLSFRQSSTMNGSPSFTLFGTQPFQMPKLNNSPTCTMNGERNSGRTDTMVHFNGMGVSSNHHRTLPPVINDWNGWGRSLPLAPGLEPPPPPAPSNHVAPKPHSGQNGGFGVGLSNLFNNRGVANQEVDWI